MEETRGAEGLWRPGHPSGPALVCCCCHLICRKGRKKDSSQNQNWKQKYCMIGLHLQQGENVCYCVRSNDQRDSQQASVP